ncbi:hypothetical protein D9M68_165970 [compost metagenome]
MIEFSPGVADGCFSLMRITLDHQMTFAQLRAEMPRVGSIETGRLIEIAQALQWVRASDGGAVVLTARGARVHGIASSRDKLRRALLDYVELHRPAWIKNTMKGRSETLAFSPSEIAQCLVEAGLATGSADDVVDFWDAIAAIARGLQGARLNEIGRAGERLSLKHEERRTGSKPIWRAIESNLDGYDVQSIVARGDARPIQIEVKATEQGLHGKFHLTRNEWDATANMPRHCLHLWDLSAKASPRLAVLPRGAVETHIPADSGFGRWELVELSFQPFEAFFCEPFADAPGPD